MRSSSPRPPARRRRPTPPARALDPGRPAARGRASSRSRSRRGSGPTSRRSPAERLRRRPRRRRTPPRHGPPLAPRVRAGRLSRRSPALAYRSSLRLAPLLVVDMDGTHGRLDDRPVDAWGSDRDRRSEGPRPYLRARPRRGRLVGGRRRRARRRAACRGDRGDGRDMRRDADRRLRRGCDTRPRRRGARSVRAHRRAREQRRDLHQHPEEALRRAHRCRVGPDVRGQRPRDVALLQGGDTGDEGGPFGPDRERLLDDRAGRNPPVPPLRRVEGGDRRVSRARSRASSASGASASMPSHRTTSPTTRRTRLSSPRWRPCSPGSDASSAT